MEQTIYISKDIYSNQIIWSSPSQTSDELLQRIDELKLRQKIFYALPVTSRMQLISVIETILIANKTYFATLICEEVGRCLRECEAEIDKTIALVRYYTSIAAPLLDAKPVVTQASLSEVRFEPLGLVFSVMPWNYPIWQMMRFAIPALCCGNACLIKPALSVGRVTEVFFRLLPQELPLDFIFLENETVELAIAKADGFAFTGSVVTGQKLASLAGKYLKKSVLELGGSNAVIVFADADIKQAAIDACYSRFRDAGQSCNAAKRIIVEESIAEEFLQYFIAVTRKITLGDPKLESTQMGPLHLVDGPLTLQKYVDDARQKGARCLLGGHLLDHPAFYPPTILDNVAGNSLVLTEEVFGPVVPIIRVANKEEAILSANQTAFGLGASIYSSNIPIAWDYGKQLECGSVYINRHTSSDLKMPFGGIKSSGYGRELSEFGLYEFVNIKSYWQK